MARPRGQEGQASVELIGTIPALVLLVAVAVQFALVGYSLWTAGTAARAGARAAFVGGDAEHASRASLPAALRKGARVRAAGGVSVRVRAPSLIPGLPRVPLTARAGFGVGDAGSR